MAHDVFISYSHHDKPTADAVCAKLEEDGIRCWYAPRDIQPGADWAGSIVHAIEASRIMVLIYTDQSNLSRQVLNEISVAVNRGVIVIPFRLTDATPSKGLQYYFTSIHWLDAVDRPLEKSIDELRQMIRRFLSGTPEEPEPAIPADTKAKPKRNRWIIAAAIVLALAVAAVFLVPRLLSGKNTDGPLPWPENGEVWQNDPDRKEELHLIIQVEHLPDDEACFVRLYRDGKPVSGLFISGSGEASVDLSAGAYMFRIGFGSLWYGGRELFGKTGSYNALFWDETPVWDSPTIHTVELKAGFSHKITISLESVDDGGGIEPDTWENIVE